MVNEIRTPCKLDSINVSFDDERLVADAGVLLPATLAECHGRLKSVPLWPALTEVSSATSEGWPRWAKPPTPEYSPSVFSRTTTKSTSSGFRSASRPRTPG